VGYFYQEIGDKLLIGAQQTLSKYGIDEKNVDIFYAPGAFEIPLLAKKLATTSKPKPFKAFSFLGLPKIRIFPTPKSDKICAPTP
jgi:6,7-dimethyl-8-ribityllumazine synthase